MGKHLRSSVIVLIILSQLLVPFAYAQDYQDPTDDTSVLFGNQPNQNKQATVRSTEGTQAAAFNEGTEGTTSSGGAAEDSIGEAVSCSAGQILGGILAAGVSGIMSEITSVLSLDTVTSAVGIYVPTDPQTIKTEIKNINIDTARQANKSVGGGHLGFVDSLVNSVTTISWDSIGFCLANAAVRYIAQSTVNWINSGFEGNPTFVDNPGQFFQDLADYEIGAFMDEIGAGFLCSGIAPKVRIAVINDYMNRTGGKTFNDRHKCSFEQIGTSLESFVNNFKQGGVNAFIEYSLNPASRVTTSYLAANNELNRRISDKQTIASFELRVSDFLNFKKCDTTRDPNSGKDVKSNCKTYTPGQLIEEQANSALDSGRRRIEIADEFDEVITALVDQLIRVALSEVTSIDQDSTSEDSEEDSEEEEDGGGSTDNGTGGYVPTRPTPITGRCIAATTTVAVDYPLQLSLVNVGGGTGRYRFDWLGGDNFPTATQDRVITVSFATSTNETDVRVRVRSGSLQRVINCPDITVTPAVPLEVSCRADDSNVRVGEFVTWESEVSGGNGEYGYEWSGDIDSFDEDSQDNTVTYNRKGTYEASLKVTSGRQTKTVDCSNSVRVK